ncbi:hypothetical protein FE633_05880 [Streptomyces montanus]|uniref:Beta-galactosidase n=1 Tax=Streptomyces montanus TaxID=2580423 RepID=A0A5R9FUH3_9ACTN|nr:hypothetical protein FE633_05880 [Streptomyces montanus]
MRQPAYPGAFRTLIGGCIDEYWPARDGETFEVRFADGTIVRAHWWQDSIHPETADVIASYTSGHLSGRAAILDHAVGDGRVLYIGTRLPADPLRDTVLAAVADAGVRPLVTEAPAFVEVARRTSGEAAFLFLLNHSETDTAHIPLPEEGFDLISGKETGGSITLAPLDLAVVRTALADVRSS